MLGQLITSEPFDTSEATSRVQERQSRNLARAFEKNLGGKW
jgi:hypothetical protein